MKAIRGILVALVPCLFILPVKAASIDLSYHLVSNTSADISAVGSTDWAYWSASTNPYPGVPSAAPPTNEKSGGPGLIGDAYPVAGLGELRGTSNTTGQPLITFDCSDGTSPATGSLTGPRGVFNKQLDIVNNGVGVDITLPATGTYRVSVWVAAFASTGRLDATLPGADAKTDSSLTYSTAGKGVARYDLTVSPDTAGDKLSISYVMQTDGTPSNSHVLILGAAIGGPIDPVFKLSGTSPDPDLTFGTVWGTPNVSRTLTYEVSSPSATGTVTVDDVILTDDAGTPGTFTLGSIVPAVGTPLGDGDTVSITVTANGMATGTFAGSLFIDTTAAGPFAGADDYDTTVPVSLGYYLPGDSLNLNPTMDSNLTNWGGGSTHISPGIAPRSIGMARVKGSGDPAGGNPDSLYQATAIPNGAPDWEITSYFTPINPVNFGSYVDPSGSIAGADGDYTDRTFQWVLLGADTPLPIPYYGDANAANTLINLAYMPDGIPGSAVPDFYVYDGTAWVPTGIGAIQGSIDNDTDADPTNGFGDGLLDTATDPSDVVNVYKLSVKGTGFGTGAAATYDISVTKVSGPDTFTSASATSLSAFHGLDGSTSAPGAYAFLTGDVSSSSNVDDGLTTSFWVDDTHYYAVAAPDPILTVLTQPQTIQILDPATTGSSTFTITNQGANTTLDVTSISFSSSGLSITSPTLPFSVLPDAIQEIEVTFDSAVVAPGNSVSAIMTLNSNSVQDPSHEFLIEGFKSSPSQLLANGDFEVAGTGGDVFAFWIATQSDGLAAVSGLTSGSTTAAYLNRTVAGRSGGSTLFQDLATPASEFIIDFDFAVKDTILRALQFNLYAADNNSMMNLRYEGGIWSVYNGVAWIAVLDLSANPLTPSEDNDGNGSLDDVGDVKAVYHLRVTGNGYGTGSPTLSIEVFDSGGNSLGSASGLSAYESGAPTTAGLGRLKFESSLVNNPGFWIDSVQVSQTEPPVPSGPITLTNPVHNGADFSVDITASGNVDIYRSTTLLPGSWGSAIDTDVSPGTSVVVDSAAPAGKAFYIALPTGSPGP